MHMPRTGAITRNYSRPASRRRQPQPVADLAYNPEDIKARLSAVNVYTVANKKKEFVLVSGEVRRAHLSGRNLGLSSPGRVPCDHVAYPSVCAATFPAWLRLEAHELESRRGSTAAQGDSEERQLGLFFFKEADAKALIDKVSTVTSPSQPVNEYPLACDSQQH